MDIKTTRSSLSQDAGAALDPKSGSADTPSLISQFVIRTMAGDLQKEAGQAGSAAPAPKAANKPALPTAAALPPTSPVPAAKIPEPAPIKPPAPPLKSVPVISVPLEKETPNKLELKQPTATETKKITQEAAPKALPKKPEPENQLLKLLQQTRLALTAKEFDLVESNVQKIINDPQATWLVKWRANRLAGAAQKERAARSVVPAIKKVEKPAPLPQPTTAKSSAPPNLPLPPEEITAVFTPKPAAPAIKTETKLEPSFLASPATTAIAASPKPIPAPRPPVIPPSQQPKMEAEAEIDIKKVLAVGLISLFVLALLIGGAWYFLQKPSGQPAQSSQSATPSPATPTPAILPPALFSADVKQVFELKTGQIAIDLKEALARSVQTEESTGSFTSLLFKDGQGNFLSLENLASSTKIDLFDLPTQLNGKSLKELLDLSRFSFFSYSQADTSSSPFTAQANAGRLGLIITAAPAATNDDLSKGLRDLEPFLPGALQILLPKNQTSLPAKPAFLDSAYRGAAIRYINLSGPELSLDYAILNNKLIFATSKESMLAIIDRLLDQPQP